VNIWKLDIQLKARSVVGLTKDLNRTLLFSSRPSKKQVVRILHNERAAIVQRQADSYTKQSGYYSVFGDLASGDTEKCLRLFGMSTNPNHAFYTRNRLRGMLEDLIRDAQLEIESIKSEIRLATAVLDAVERTNWHLKTFGTPAGSSYPPVALKEIELEEGECCEQFDGDDE